MSRKYVSNIYGEEGYDIWHFEPTDHLVFYHIPDKNIFMDGDGELVDDIFAYITPNDLCIFRHDPGCCVFHKRDDYNILIELNADEDNPIYHNSACLYDLPFCLYADFCEADGICQRARFIEKDEPFCMCAHVGEVIF